MSSLLGQVQQDAQALSAGRHTITLTDDGPDISGSTEELRSAFGNLVSNAVRYTPDGGQIDMVWQQGQGGPQFAVRDNGIGVSAEHISRLTERFYRVDKSRSRETRGTGLGLAIVKHVLLRHGAQLDIESEPGRGSTFTVTFPVRAVIPDAVPLPAASA
jgi:two-component system phosphate regulon sensor histidine kinase PhoR